jgi:hypothetical protein
MKKTLALAYLLWISTSLPGITQSASSQEEAGVIAIRSAVSDIDVDGYVDEPAWDDATPISLDYEWLPGDNVQPPVDTIALVTYDDSYIYVGFKAYDPNPSQIRAHIMDRDAIATFSQDDHITVMIDPFNDQRRGFQFRVNPLGVQADALWSEIDIIEDFSWDIIWDSAGHINSKGYEVEMAIPLNQIRFPRSEGEQTWGVMLSRSYPRSNRHRMSANMRDRNQTCLLCQVNKIKGFQNIEPGWNFELDPTLTMTRTDVRPDFPSGGLEPETEDIEPGITARWSITPNTSLNAAINPDFSQVEADAAQLAINERFALFFPEKRPFFLEGVDFFSTPLNAVFTRTVVNPKWGAKVTGKEGKNAYGVFLTRDRVNNLVLPSNQESSSAFLNQEITGSVFRYRRDIGNASTLGVIYAGREGESYHNRVGGVDGFIRLSPSNEIRFQFLRSDTFYPEEVVADTGGEREHRGSGIDARYRHQSRNWAGQVEYEGLAPGFRADSGFIPRVDVRTVRSNLNRTFWGEPEDWYVQFNAGGSFEYTENFDGQLTDREFRVFGNFMGPMQSFFEAGYSRRTELFSDVVYEGLPQLDLFFQAQPSGAIRLAVGGVFGRTVDISNNRQAGIFQFFPSLELKLGRRINVQLDHTLQRLDDDGPEIFTANLSEARLFYHFNLRTFVRAIFQYRHITRNPELYAREVEPTTEQLFTQFLFSYKLNPQTVVFVGYSDTALGFEDLSLTRASRTFFVKLGYAWLL